MQKLSERLIPTYNLEVKEMVTVSNMTCGMDMNEKISFVKLLETFPTETRLTGKCDTFDWSMKELGIGLRLNADQARVINNNLQHSRGYLPNLLALLKVNNYYSKPRSLQQSFILSSDETKYLYRMFKSVTWTISETGCTALVYESGKLVILGCKSVTQFHRVVDVIFLKLKNNGIIRGCARVQSSINNFVKSGNISLNSIKLDHLVNFLRTEARSICCNVSFESELFPALHCTINNVTCLVFRTSKVILTGCKDSDKMDSVFNILQTLVKKFDTISFVDSLLVDL